MATPSKNSTKLRVGDQVVVIAGAHKGEEGRIVRFTKDRNRVFVEGVNKVRRHQKPVPAMGRPGGIIEKEASVHISNVALSTGDGPSRIGFRTSDDGSKVRFAKKTGDQIGKNA